MPHTFFFFLSQFLSKGLEVILFFSFKTLKYKGKIPVQDNDRRDRSFPFFHLITLTLGVSTTFLYVFILTHSILTDPPFEIQFFRSLFVKDRLSDKLNMNYVTKVRLRITAGNVSAFFKEIYGLVTTVTKVYFSYI